MARDELFNRRDGSRRKRAAAVDGGAVDGNLHADLLAYRADGAWGAVESARYAAMPSCHDGMAHPSSRNRPLSRAENAGLRAGIFHWPAEIGSTVEATP